MGFNIVLSSPSGAGKTTITKKLSQKYPNIKISISHTTRKPRPNEIDGVDYHFVGKEEFKKLIKKDTFYEHAQIFDNYYGTSKESVNKLHLENYDVEIALQVELNFCCQVFFHKTRTYNIFNTKFNDIH